MTGYFIYDNIDTRNYQGIVVSEDEVDSSPARVYDEITIAGKNGTLLLDAKRYENVIHSYDVVVYGNYVNNLIQLRNDLLSKVGYKTLRDGFNPDEKYLAVVTASLNPNQKKQRNAGSMHIEFSRKPQRFLISGDSPYGFPSASSIVNPTKFPSKPLIKTTGPGTVGIGSQIITVSDVSSSTVIYIDCETMEIYTMSGGIKSGAGSHVSFNTNDFPTIPAGTSGFSKTTQAVEIIPRWWRI